MAKNLKIAKRPHPGAQDGAATAAALPSKEEILAFISRERKAAFEAGSAHPDKVGKREIAKAFNIKGAARIELKRMLKELEAEGRFEKRGKTMHTPGRLPNVVLVDVGARDRDGELVATPVEWDADEHGPAPRIAIWAPRRAGPGSPMPGVGDRALVRVELEREPEEGAPAYRGRVIKVLEKARAQLVGVYRALASGGGRLMPIEKRNVGRELPIQPGDEGDARDGDLVSVDLQRPGRSGRPSAKVVERLGAVDNEKAISLIALITHNIPYVFRPDTIAESERAKPATMDHREDWRDLPLVTIDPADAKDHDDAIHARPDDDPENPGGFILTVAIADVAAYVRPGSPLDREALDRGNSVYFPDRVVPMLPERISNDLCSLRPNEDRPAMAVRMIINREGRKLRHTFHRVMMRSAAKLAYPQAQAAIDGWPDDTTKPLLDSVLKPLWEAYHALKIARHHRSPLDLDLPERKLVLKPDGKVDRVIVPPRLDAHRLIEEFMILANVAAAETLEARGQMLVYRAHDEPSVEKINALSEFLTTLGIKLAKGQNLRPQNFNGILERVKDTEHENIVNEVVLRTQSQAEYVSENYGHFGLNLKRYAHFTSPIRRYADLIVHRALVRGLKLGPDGSADMRPDELAEVAARISAAERRAMAAERETTDRLIATFLCEQVGATFSGRISGVTRSGLFVKLFDTGADGFVPAATLGNDYFRHEEHLHALIGSRTGETYRLGDSVDVRLVEAAPFAGALRFEVVSAGKSRREVPGAAAKPRKPPGRDKKPTGRKENAWPDTRKSKPAPRHRAR
ncbi:MAG: rnr [Hyphomicrobiales bacterium]|nr:rnr [Hyphomicrobiales bacterium]